MAPARHLVVFMRAPLLGAVKRRLAAGIGAEAARRFYVTTGRRLLARVGRDPRWLTTLAVTPDRFAAEGRFWPADLPRLAQGPGDIGCRMARALRAFDDVPTVLVGSDIPGIERRHIAAAFAALRRTDLVFGPARDGGYWLVGARRAAAVSGLFRNVRWSGPYALADTLANARGRRIAFVEPLDDVDTAADLARFNARSSAASTRRNCTACAGYRAGP